MLRPESEKPVIHEDDDPELDEMIEKLSSLRKEYRAKDNALKREIAEIRIRRRALMDHRAWVRGLPPIRWPPETLE
jgi:hypothetical protein